MVLVAAVEDDEDVDVCVTCDGTRTEFSDGLMANSGMEICMISKPHT